MKEYSRTERIGAELRRELTQVLQREVGDPRLASITLQEVRVSRDLAHAKVYFTCLLGEDRGDEQERLLNSALAGFLRRALARRTRLRAVPRLRFVHDRSVSQGEHLSRLIESAVGTGTSESDPR